MKIENLGPKLHASFGEGAIIRSEVGRSTVCFVQNGLPAVFHEFCLFTGELLFSKPLPGQDCVWGICKTKDEEVYLFFINF